MDTTTSPVWRTCTTRLYCQVLPGKEREEGSWPSKQQHHDAQREAAVQNHVWRLWLENAGQMWIYSTTDSHSVCKTSIAWKVRRNSTNPIVNYPSPDGREDDVANKDRDKEEADGQLTDSKLQKLFNSNVSNHHWILNTYTCTHMFMIKWVWWATQLTRWWW